MSDPARRRAVAPAVVLGPGGAVHVLYYDLQDDAVDYQGLEGPRWDGNWSLVLATSTDGGGKFGSGAVVEDAIVPPERVMLIYTMPAAAVAVDREGRAFVAWYDLRNGDWDVFLRRSTDRGRTWERRRRLSDDAPRNGSHQYLPRLSVAPNGRIDAMFYDRRGDSKNVRNDVAYTYSDDGGRTFADSRRVTSESSDAGIGQTYLVPSAAGLVEFGSRLASLSLNSRFVGAWTDTRNFTRGSQQEIFAAEVEFASSGRRAGSRLGAAAVFVFVLTGGVLAYTLRRRRSGRRATGSVASREGAAGD